MKWTVIYRPSAQDQLADIWLSAPDPQAVAEAAGAIDRILASNPLDASESRGGNSRTIIQRPLTVLYDVYQDDALAEVFAVYYLESALAETPHESYIIALVQAEAPFTSRSFFEDGTAQIPAPPNGNDRIN